jgi:hypothetical protein
VIFKLVVHDKDRLAAAFQSTFLAIAFVWGWPRACWLLASMLKVEMLKVEMLKVEMLKVEMPVAANVLSLVMPTHRSSTAGLRRWLKRCL